MHKTVVLNRCTVEFIRVCRQISRHPIKYFEQFSFFVFFTFKWAAKIKLPNMCAANSKRLRNKVPKITIHKWRPIYKKKSNVSCKNPLLKIWGLFPGLSGKNRPNYCFLTKLCRSTVRYFLKVCNNGRKETLEGRS